MDTAMRHPSGRPIRQRVVVGRPYWRIPEGPTIPRLTRAGLAHIIVFLAN